MKSILIDHDDSFTQNLKHWLKPLFDEIQVINHTHFIEIKKNDIVKLESQFDLFIFSPGPKSPQDYPHSLVLLQNLNLSTPVYGVCLGLQMMAEACEKSVSSYTPPRHGKTSQLNILNPDFQEFQNLNVARYHSIKANQDIQQQFNIIAESQDDHHPMWIKHKVKHWMAIQFHPESFLTEKPKLHLKALNDWLKT